MSKIMDTQNCFHCGLDIKAEEIIFDDKIFVATVAKPLRNFQRQ
jgi:Cu+-exporting ATPase